MKFVTHIVIPIFAAMFLVTSAGAQETAPSDETEPQVTTEKLETDTYAEETEVEQEVLRDLSILPFPTRRMHELILEGNQIW